jgi:hypothetical protein
MHNLETNGLFEVGDFVKFKDIEGEIVNLHLKYATIVSEGIEYRAWISEMEMSDNYPKRNQIYKDSLIYKGYKTKNFTRDLSESFKIVYSDTTDEYAMLECIKLFDEILGVTDDEISENYNTVKIKVERLKRYSYKVDASDLTEEVIAVIEEELLKYAILEGVKFSTTDRVMVAKVIAMVAGIINISNQDPTNIVNQAVMILRSNQLTTPGLVMLGRLLNIATRAGIRWNKDTFSNSIQTQMGLI